MIELAPVVTALGFFLFILAATNQDFAVGDPRAVYEWLLEDDKKALEGTFFGILGYDPEGLNSEQIQKHFLMTRADEYLIKIKEAVAWMNDNPG